MPRKRIFNFLLVPLKNFALKVKLKKILNLPSMYFEIKLCDTAMKLGKFEI